jgi:hypothetical protein
MNCDYREVKIEPDGVIYCDIPYKNTDQYNIEFDHEAFYDWCEQQEVPVYISEYQMPEDRFECVWQKEKSVLFSRALSQKKAVEKLYTIRR